MLQQWSLELDPIFEPLAAADSFSGVALLEQGGVERYARAFGPATRAWPVPNIIETRFDVASVTKLFTAVATLQLIERGQLSFDTRAMPTLGIVGTAISDDVTVEQLLTHTSGIGDDADEEAGERYEDVWRDRPNYSVTTTEAFLPQFVSKPPNFAPGQGARYCNVSYVLLGLLIERAIGRSYREYILEHVFALCGMTQSGFFRMDQAAADVAEGWDPLVDPRGARAGWRRNIYSYPPIGSPDGGAHVIARDLTRFFAALRFGKLLGPELTAAFFVSRTSARATSNGQLSYGYGLQFYHDDAGELLFFEKDGSNAGVSALLRHWPRQDITLVLLSNMADGAWEPARAIRDFVATLLPKT